MQDHLSFRLFTDADAQQLTDLLHQAYAPLGQLGLNYTAVDQDQGTTLRRAISGATWMLFDGDDLAGSITMSMPPEPLLQELTDQARVPGRVWLNQFAVAPAHQGKGYGSLLRARALAWARTQGATSVGLDTGANAHWLISLYRHWGFNFVDEVQRPGKNYRSVIMARQIPSNRLSKLRDLSLAQLLAEVRQGDQPADQHTKSAQFCAM